MSDFLFISLRPFFYAALAKRWKVEFRSTCGIKVDFTCNLFAVFLLFQAWLWMQVMRSLRQGVRLKKCQHVTHVSRTSPEFELSPFEMLMQDIRFRRYTLHNVMVSLCCCLVMHLRIDLIKILFPV